MAQSIKDKFKDRLKDKLSQHQNSNTPLSKISSKEKENMEELLSDVIDFKKIETLTEDQELVKLLKENTIKIFSIQSKAVLELGEIFNHVYEKLSKQGSSEGIYTKWLEINGVIPRTALNYRKRFILYSVVNEIGKKTVKKMPQKLIDIIVNSENKVFIEELNAGKTKEDLEKRLNLIEEKPSESFPKVKNNSIEISNYLKIFDDFTTKYEDLEAKKKEKVIKYLEKINEILSKVSL
ncbi:MAG: hypothetical protein ACRC1R_03625 [Cetobacterium sp.]|uniref:hypothetical protein n=1 Tax=Cetobacterium sp. TaxID=2071632 RepID=UPI003F30DB3A